MKKVNQNSLLGNFILIMISVLVCPLWIPPQIFRVLGKTFNFIGNKLIIVFDYLIVPGRYLFEYLEKKFTYTEITQDDIDKILGRRRGNAQVIKK